MRSRFLVALLAAVVPCASGQRMVPSATHFASPHPGASASTGVFGARFRGFDRDAHSGSFFYPLAFSDALYADYLSGTGYPVASLPPVIILESPPPASSEERSSPPAQPLMIELQGDRYVRVSGDETSGAERIDQEPASSHRREKPLDAAQARSAPERAPAVLVFRDGHREEVSEYTIADGVLYARGNYYRDGSWNKRIELSSLDLQETIQSNQSRGVGFQLPNSPNEVIVGP